MTTNTMQAPHGALIQTGQPVYTLDNSRLGQVADMTDTHFKVHIRFRKDFWLARDQVAFVDEQCVGMLFRKEEAELYKLSEPSDDGFQRRFDRKRPMPGDGVTDANWRDRFPLS